jgi:quinoprotein glucose dehydrogenase
MSVKLAAMVVLVGLMSAVAFRSTSHAQQPPPTRSVWDGVYTKEQATRGEPIYAARCESCHGATMEGGEMAPALTGPTFLANWDGLTVGDLFDRTRLTMPQDDPGSLPRNQLADVTAEILRVNRFPAGETDLDTRTEVLKQILIQAYKP